MVSQADLDKYGPRLPERIITDVWRDPKNPGGAWVTVSEGQDSWWIPDSAFASEDDTQ
jgi:hypothetical protein